MTEALAAQSPAASDPEALLRALGLFAQAANRPKLDGRALERFARRELPFDWVHMGNSELRIGALVHVLQSAPPLCAPRTGHIGNWSNIVHGCAGPRDYNNLTCGRHGLGYPLLFDFNQTESDSPGMGDWSYLPGSVVERTQRHELPLLTWDGHTFVRRDRKLPLFTPFTMTERDGQLVSLCSFHRQACGKERRFRFRFQSSLLDRSRALLRRILRVLLAHACRQDEPTQLLRRLLDRCVRLDGQVERVELSWSPLGFRMGETRYRDVDDLIEHVLLPVRAAARPGAYQDMVRDLPARMPLISAPLFVLLLAVMNAHFPDGERVPTAWTRPCNPHLHWGGIPMAGYPPSVRGYFTESARHLRKLFQPVVRDLADVDPVILVLLPAGVFNLCPHDAFPDDVELVSQLMRKVGARSRHLVGRPAEMSTEIAATVTDWHASNAGRLSDYFASRFAGGAAGVASLSAAREGEPLLVPDFLDLTLQQASMTMGALGSQPWPVR